MGGRGAGGGFAANSQLQDEAVEWYVSGDGMWINQYLRGNTEAFGELSENEKALIKGLDAATSKTLDGIDTLYRSVDAQAIFGSMSDTQYENLVSGLVYGDKSGFVQRDVKALLQRANGKSITEKGFMSTTTDAQIASDWGGFSGSSKPVVIEFEKPKGGIKGKNLTSHYMQQSEVLLSRNQRYTVQSIGAKNGNIWIKAKFN